MPTKFCRHIKVNGDRCASVSLLSGVFCYYHADSANRHRNLRRAASDPAILHPMTLQDGRQRNPISAEIPPLPFDLPPLEDRHSIQLALSLLISALARNQVDPRRAALLFYGLQIASTNARQLSPEPKDRPAKVTDTILDEATGELIAPDEDPGEPEEYSRKGTASYYVEKFEREIKEEERLRDEKIAELASQIASQLVAQNVPEPEAQQTAELAIQQATEQVKADRWPRV
ncbi:MAG: hypothetical protein WBY53_08360 [Acidobacteriaceae bacterium]